MFLYRAVVDQADCQQLVVIKRTLADIEHRFDGLLPIRQFSLFQKDPSNDNADSGELDLWIALEDDLTAPQFSLLEHEVEAAVRSNDQSAASKTHPRIVEELTCL